ncbi:hypothetical protein EML15_03095 [Corynebacterium sp. sy017]|uniref:DsbA family protein n=1 Tax=unclassified Corynebacterium TaxID=2624378 RepID=UPI00118586E6|nr:MULTISPECIES: thioredoxin domain-containing protein [unclassified Corynebacterium]MBP3088139.1 hypothetical protein [Corynebacterium sp. sy017]TSD92655.1 hypothetical protein ELY17_03095 [Corynebacterium sp. SY003]
MSSSSKVKNPNEKSHGFVWAIVALLVVIIAVVAYIVIDGKKANSERIAQNTESVGFNVSFADNAVVLKSDKAAADAKNVEVYEDFACPHCADLATATDEAMKKAIEDGKIIVHIRSLNFLDGMAESKPGREALTTINGHATKAGTAAYVVAKAQEGDAYWNFRKYLLENQSDIYGSVDEEQLSKLAADYGASSDVVKTIKSGSEKESYRKVALANYDTLDKEHDGVSSPRIFINGEEYTGENGRMEGWVEAATK